MPRQSLATYGFKSRRVTIVLSGDDWQAIAIPVDLANRVASERLQLLLYHYAEGVRRSLIRASIPYPLGPVCQGKEGLR